MDEQPKCIKTHVARVLDEDGSRFIGVEVCHGDLAFSFRRDRQGVVSRSFPLGLRRVALLDPEDCPGAD